MNRTLEPLKLSTVELVYLAGLLEVNQLVGTPDPFRGWLTEEIGPALAAARQSLADRGLITLNADETIDADPATAELVRTLGSPAGTFAFTRDAIVRYIHVAPDLVVEQASEAKAGTSTLTPMSSPDEAASHLMQIIGLGDQPAAAGVIGTVSAAKLKEIRSATSHDQAQAALVEAGMPAESAASLAQALTKPISSCSLSALAERQGHTANLTLLQGESGLWHLRLYYQQGEPWVELRPCTGAEATAAIAALLQQGMPAA